MKLIIHRGAHEVGGSCVEISSEESKILVDFGLPLDFDFTTDKIESCLPDTVSKLLKQDGTSIDGVLLSHPHLDHYGLASQIPESVPVYCGKAAWELMNATAQFTHNKVAIHCAKHFKSYQSFQIGDFAITPYLMDHSAFDSYGFLIFAGGKNIFYSGDFRGHGRKSKLFNQLPDKLPQLDALLMEGTLVGNRGNEAHSSEAELEEAFVGTIKSTKGIVLITTSSQNIDRLVTIFRAAKRCGRMFIIDFYTAEILETLKGYARLPNAEWPRIKVCYPQNLARHFEKEGLDDILERHRKNGIKWTRLNEIKNKIVMLVRPGFIWDLKRFIDLEKATWVYSMWPGYFEKNDSLRRLKSFLEGRGVAYEYLHTSGHSRLEDLKTFVQKVSPKMLVPIHSFNPSQYQDHFENVRLLSDGEELSL